MPCDDHPDEVGDADPGHGTSGRTFVALAGVQDELLTATTDLERLQTLLDESHAALQHGFFGTWRVLHALQQHDPVTTASIAPALAHLASAMKALQFHDLASQLLAHTQSRLRIGADSIARTAFAGDDDDEALGDDIPLRPNPVTQAAMDEGLIELF